MLREVQAGDPKSRKSDHDQQQRSEEYGDTLYAVWDDQVYLWQQPNDVSIYLAEIAGGNSTSLLNLYQT
jgi:hypothetical protein